MTLQFDSAVPSGTPAANCVSCKTPIVGAYYFGGGKAIVCERCKALIDASKRAAVPPVAIARATLCGAGGALAGTALYAIVLAAEPTLMGYVAVAVGYFVGRAMQYGSGGRRGVTLQIIAMALTFGGIALGLGGAYMYAWYTAYWGDSGLLSVLNAELRRAPYSYVTGAIAGIAAVYASNMVRSPKKLRFQGPFRIGVQA